MGEIMNSTKNVKSGVPERVSISCPTFDMWHPSRFTPNNWKPVICHS